MFIKHMVLLPLNVYGLFHGVVIAYVYELLYTGNHLTANDEK